MILVSLSLCRRPQPVDVIEAAVHIDALFPGRTLVAEQRPQLLVVVEAGDQVALHLLEERHGLDVLEQGHALVRGLHLGIRHAVALCGTLVQVLDALGQQLFHALVLHGRRVVRRHGLDVEALGQLVVRVDIARHAHQGLAGRRTQVAKALPGRYILGGREAGCGNDRDADGSQAAAAQKAAPLQRGPLVQHAHGAGD